MTPDHPRKLFLLDAMALIYRAYFAFSRNPRMTSKGMNTSAVFGFTNTLIEILMKEKPSHIAVVFDTHAPTLRHEVHTDYKANRAETPEDIIKAVPYVTRVSEAFKIPVLFKDGYEADDIIGTLAKEAEKTGFQVYMMTPDKDFGQLVSDHVLIYKPSIKGNPPEILGIKEVCNKYNIKKPEQVIDILGLMGDAVDNIPGLPGVGEKTAIELIKEFGSIENLLENTDKVKGKLREKIEQNSQTARMSKDLATIRCDVPLDYKWVDLEFKSPDKKALLDVFNELEFKTIAARVLKEFFPSEYSELRENVDAPKNITDIKVNYTTSDPALLDSLLHRLSENNKFSFYPAYNENGIEGIAFSDKEGEATFVPFNGAEAPWGSIKKLFENTKTRISGYDLKKSMNFFRKYDIEMKGNLFDVLLASFLIRPEAVHYLPDIAHNFLGLNILEIGSESRKVQKDQLKMGMVSDEQLKQLGCERADMLFRLLPVLESKMDESSVKKLFEEVEMPLEKVLSDMETEGVKVDKIALKELSGKLTTDIEQLRKEIWAMADMEFNIDSPRQVGEVLFEKLKVSDNVKKTKTGQYSTGEEVLSELAAAHPIVAKILEYRELQKLINTYVDALPQMIDKKTGRIHTSFNQVVAATGRLSSENPNLQNIPIRTERGREIRKAFVAGDERKVLLSADYSQIELRIIASLSGDKAMIDYFHEKHDIHAATAAKLYNVPIELVTPEMRRNAKTVNFGIIYGISGFGLSQRLGIPRKEAQEIINEYFKQYPRIKEYMDKSIAFARDKGYVETMLGRRRYLPDINSKNYAVRGFAERNAINAPIQGSAADMIKVAMLNIHKEIARHKLLSKMVLQVHDELVFDAYPKEMDTLKEIVSEKMKTAIPLDVPVEVNMGVGKNWLEAH